MTELINLQRYHRSSCWNIQVFGLVLLSATPWIPLVPYRGEGQERLCRQTLCHRPGANYGRKIRRRKAKFFPKSRNKKTLIHGKMSKRVDKIDNNSKWGRVAGVEKQIRGSAVNAAVQINEPMTLTMAPIQEIGCKSIKIQVCKLLYFVQANTKQIDDKTKQLSLNNSSS